MMLGIGIGVNLGQNCCCCCTGDTPAPAMSAYVIDTYTSTIFVQYLDTPTATSFTAGVTADVNGSGGHSPIFAQLEPTQGTNIVGYLFEITFVLGDDVDWIYNSGPGNTSAGGVPLDSMTIRADNRLTV